MNYVINVWHELYNEITFAVVYSLQLAIVDILVHGRSSKFIVIKINRLNIRNSNIPMIT